jgi:autotransporter-associated beta strand protein/T5SS/PEP-CTERM-associated repeat protein
MNDDFFYVGVFGSGRLRLTGGVIRNTYAIAGYDPGADGNIEVSGGKWLSSDFLVIGRKSAAAMTITDGYVENTNGVVGYYAEGSGAVLIAGGTWANSGNLTVGLSGTGTLTMNGGLVTVGGMLSKGTYGTINLQPGGTLQIGTGGTTGVLGVSSLTNNGTLVFNRSDASAYSGVLSGTGAISKQGGGTLTFSGPNTLTGPTTIRQGTLQIAHASALSASTISVLAGGTLALTPGLVTTIGGLKPNAGGVVDVGTGLITVSKGLSVLNAYVALVTGRGDGAWDGAAGITSSDAASSNGTRTVGWLDNGDGSVTFAYAAAGDTNLDWIVDILDVAKFITAKKYDSGRSSTWAEGDFNYDGFTDITDAADFFATGLYDAGPYNTPAGSIAAVPEPSVLGPFGVGAGIAGLMAMRRKRAAKKLTVGIDRRAA